MKELILKYLHFIILGVVLYQTYGDFTAYETEISDLRSRVEPLNLKIKKVEKKIESIKEFEASAIEYEKKIEDIEGQIKSLSDKLPAEDDMPKILQKLANEAEELNLKEVNFSRNPSQVKDFGYYKSHGIEVKGTGTFLQFLILFERLSKSEHIFNISKLTIAESKTKSRGRFQLVDIYTLIETYEFNSSYIEPEKTEPAVKANPKGRRKK